MGAVVGQTYAYSRDDMAVAAGREAFAELVFAEIERRGWWESALTREKPWKRLSREVSNSPDTLGRLIEGKTATLSEETFRRLGEETATPAEVWRYALRYNALPDDEAVTHPERARLRALIADMADDDVAILVDLGRRLLARTGTGTGTGTGTEQDTRR